MANVMRVTHNNLNLRDHPVKGSVAAIEVGDFLYQDKGFQGNSNQITLRPASAGSAGANAGDGRFQFATNFAGVSMQRHDVNTFDKDHFAYAVDCEVEVLIANSVGVATAATGNIAPGTKVGIAVTGAFVPVDDLVQIDGHHSVTVADNQAIGYTTRLIKNGDTTARVHVQSMLVFDQAGI
jgi:hypothetical protein